MPFSEGLTGNAVPSLSPGFHWQVQVPAGSESAASLAASPSPVTVTASAASGCQRQLERLQFKVAASGFKFIASAFFLSRYVALALAVTAVDP